MAGKLLAEDLHSQGVVVALVHPGAVNTDMLRSLRMARGITNEQDLNKGTITVEQSTKNIQDYINDLDMSKTGVYWACDKGETLPW
eukprot:jgi/Chrzof1/2306/Cz11g10120.t1